MSAMNYWDEDDSYLDDSEPEFVDDGDRYDKPVPRRPFRKAMRTVAAVLVSAMLFAAGTPLSWVTVLTAFLMFMIWIDIRSNNHDDTI